MARSPLTLAAAVTAAVPDASVVRVAVLTEGDAGRFDSAVADTADGGRVVVRVATDAESGRELLAQARALAALTDGVRALLPFRAPRLLGRARLAGDPVVVVDELPGYRVDAGRLPAGRGAATALGAAIAAVHALPGTVARAAQLPELTAVQARAEVARLLDRVALSRRVPVPLLARWSRAAAADRLWRFESTLTLGGLSPDGFVFRDVAGVPTVQAMLAWQGLGVGDPALDLRWLAQAPSAADDVYEAYATAGVRTPDPALRARARLYAELEFARWLVHGDDEARDDVVADAVELLTSLADTVGGDDLAVEDAPDIEDTIARLGQLPPAPVIGGHTSLETDAFDGADTMLFGAVAAAHPDGVAGAGDGSDARSGEGMPEAVEADRASQAALRRWTASG